MCKDVSVFSLISCTIVTVEYVHRPSRTVFL